MNIEMLAYFYFSDKEMVFVILFLPFFLIAMLGGCLGVVYWVFRDACNRESDYKTLRENSPRLSLIGIVISLILAAITIISKNFDGGLIANRLYFLSIIIAALTVILGVFALPRWQGFVTLINFLLVGIGVLFFLA